MKYDQAYDGEWIEPLPGYKVACCDCGLIHKIITRIRKKRVQFQAFRDNRATAQRRRSMNKQQQLGIEIRGAIKSAIDAHGPITLQNYGSASKRVEHAIRAAFRNGLISVTSNSDPQQPDHATTGGAGTTETQEQA
jgi:hypothetical protein